MFLVILALPATLSLQAADQPLRYIVIGAHPDDAESAGGIAAKLIQLGHKVRLVSMTNGNAGHYRIGGGPLAQRRFKEAKCAGDVIGAEYLVLDNDDGKLLPTLEVREQVIRLIREFQADVVMSHRTNDYHPDHRNTAIAVQDAAYMVTVPNVAPSVPHLNKNPVFMHLHDRFTEPTPFAPDVVVDIDDVAEKKFGMYHCHDSQMYEWLPYNMGVLDQVPANPGDRLSWLKQWWGPWLAEPAKMYREQLVRKYGERGRQIQYAEALQVSEYGSQPSAEDLKRLFPF